MTNDEGEPLLVRKCKTCHWETLCEGGECYDCREIRVQSAWARLMCDVIHRDSPARKADVALDRARPHTR